jgi:hypothetical protein
MKMLPRSSRVFTSATALVLLLAGCTQSVTVNPVLESSPLVESLPVTVGVFYSNDFRTAAVWQDENPNFIAKSNYLLGEPSVSLFENVFTGLFKATVEVPSWPEVSGLGPNISGVIAPSIKSFWARPPIPRGQIAGAGQYTAQIIYEFNLYEADGTLLGSWEASGFGEVYGNYRSEWVNRLRGEVTARAMRDAAAKFTSTFHSQPVVVRWLENLKTGS